MSKMRNIKDALAVRDEALQALGGCHDGDCVIWRPHGMHTNGGCRCLTDHMTRQRFARISNVFAEQVRALTSSEVE